MTEDYEVYKEGGLLRERYKKVDDISEGSYGYVSLANDTQTKKLVAVKYIFKNEELEHGSSFEGDTDMDSHNSSNQKKNEMIKHQKSLISEKVRSRLSKNICFEALYEVDIHTKVGKHKNITELYDFFDSFIIMEYCSGGDLYEAIRADLVPKKTKLITHIASQIMEAIDFVHKKGIYHRDIKPENILIEGSDWTIKLTDWGLATTETTSMDRSVGSERYMAPELFEENLDREERTEPYDCSKVDLWAIGIVLLNVVFHKNPFSVANQGDKSFCYFAANREALFDIFSTMSFDFFQVLRHSLTIDPTNRDLSSMKKELAQLGEYTLDDEYYNNLTDDGYTPPKLEEESATPVSTSTTPTTIEDGIGGKIPRISVETITPTASIKTKSKEKDPIPRFKFTKRSHPNTREGNNKHAKPIRIDNSKIIKNSRKPLAIPTPNTHINNFFHDYQAKEKESFNTRDFFTPPSVHNRYMEGIFNKSSKHRGNRNRRPSSNGNLKFTPKQGANNLSTSFGRRGSTFSQHSPSGKYVPPHSRPSSLYSGSPHIPTINSVLDGAESAPPVLTKSTYHEQHPAVVDNNENDLDDVLFTLEENDIDSFTNDIGGLAIDDTTIKGVPDSAKDIGSSSGNTGDLPDLLKSPTLARKELEPAIRNPFFDQLQEQDPNKDTVYKHKPGVYIPPHHRKSSGGNSINSQPLSPYGGEATLSVGQNSVSYEGLNARRKSSGNSRGVRNTPKGRPFMSRNHGRATTEVQQSDIFADSNAVVFEEDDNELPPFSPSSFYQAGTFRAGRKSSSVQDELIGSLEQYKNNWLMLQQQQD
ncbi:LAQU0S10e02256g1_1 [Lachancea quebecensis]|uniref:LAQU0S10e02256g1_1 n=1 Tax=Lachancea quebecensis TaxID=1654605 RepID=A0A0P1KW46_9SACH|nr:LAQU0S10e02256g1_1 [Lachancea quebecensis]